MEGLSSNFYAISHAKDGTAAVLYVPLYSCTTLLLYDSTTLLLYNSTTLLLYYSTTLLQYNRITL